MTELPLPNDPVKLKKVIENLRKQIRDLQNHVGLLQEENWSLHLEVLYAGAKGAHGQKA